MKSLNPILDERFNAICWSSLLLDIFMIKCETLSLRHFKITLWNENKWDAELFSSSL